MHHKIFVYGTLKRNQLNHRLLLDIVGSSSYLGEGVTVDRWPLVVASRYNVPFLLEAKGVGKVSDDNQKVGYLMLW